MNVCANTRGCPSIVLFGTLEGLAEGPPPCMTVPDTVTRSEGGWLPAQSIGSPSQKNNRRAANDQGRRTGYGMAVERLHDVFRLRHVADELTHALRALVRRPVPRRGRVRAVEVGYVVRASGGVVGAIVEALEVVGGARCDFDAWGDV